MVRPSLLDVSFYCGLAARLNSETGAGRAAAMGTAFHGCMAGDEKALHALTAEERAEVEGWHKPEPIQLEHRELRYEDAIIEQRLAVDIDGRPCDPEDPFALTTGTPDMLWVVEIEDVGRIVYVDDMKKSEFTTLNGPDSLQLAAYGFMACAKYDAVGYCPSIWAATEGRREFRNDGIVYLDSNEGRSLRNTVFYAAQNDSGEACTGAHCHGCYAWKRCPEYQLPVAMKGTELAALCDNENASNEDLVRALNWAKSAEKLAKQVTDSVKEHIRRGADLRESGKRYLPVMMPGRESVLSAKALRAELGNEAEKFIRRGAPYEQYRWVKE